jgi:hypothetical protein
MTTLLTVALAAALGVSDAMAQGRGGGRGGRGGPGGQGGDVGKAALLSIDAIAADLGLSDTQKEQVKAVRDELSSGRPDRGGQRGNARDMSQEERQEQRTQQQAQRDERQKKETEKVNGILDASQQKRLGEIALQVKGTAALLDKEVQSALDLSEETVASLKSEATKVGESMRSKMQELFSSGDRGAMREQFTKLRADSEKQILAVLSPGEQEKFKAMQGTKLDLSPEDLRGAMGRGGQRGGQRGGGQGGGRPNRDSRPELE